MPTLRDLVKDEPRSKDTSLYSNKVIDKNIPPATNSKIAKKHRVNAMRNQLPQGNTKGGVDRLNEIKKWQEMKNQRLTSKYDAKMRTMLRKATPPVGAAMDAVSKAHSKVLLAARGAGNKALDILQRAVVGDKELRKRADYIRRTEIKAGGKAHSNELRLLRNAVPSTVSPLGAAVSAGGKLLRKALGPGIATLGAFAPTSLGTGDDNPTHTYPKYDFSKYRKRKK